MPSGPLVAATRSQSRRSPGGWARRQVDTGSAVAGGGERRDRTRARGPARRAGVRRTLERPAQGLHRTRAPWGILPRSRVLARRGRRVHAVRRGLFFGGSVLISRATPHPILK